MSILNRIKLKLKKATNGNFEAENEFYESEEEYYSEEMLKKEFILNFRALLSYKNGEATLVDFKEITKDKERKEELIGAFFNGLLISDGKDGVNHFKELFEQYNTAVQVLFNNGKIDKFELNLLTDIPTKMLNEFIKYLAKCDSFYIGV